MKNLFISHLNNDISQGPVWSVPASVKAQSEIDDVLWIDLGSAQMDHWKAVQAYHNISEFDRLTLANLPDNFKSPDLVVFEGFYRMPFVTFAKELCKNDIPYIVVPRCSLTKSAHSSKRYKKLVGDVLFFKRFAQKALCIQYLSEDEKNNSSSKWNKNSIIVPNGIDLPSICKEEFSSTGMKAIFLGRLNAYHKGLDILLESCDRVKDELMRAGFHLTIYGDKRRDYEKLNQYVTSHQLDAIVSFGGLISGEEKMESIMSADLHIMTSRFEGLPMAMIETLAYGLPALVTPGTNIQKDIINYDAGWGCNCDVEAVSNALLEIIRDKELLKKKGLNARNLAKNFCWSDIAKDFHDKILSLLSNSANM